MKYNWKQFSSIVPALALAVAALWGAPPAAAQGASRSARPLSVVSSPVTFYTDRATFAAAAANLTTLNFQSVTTDMYGAAYGTAAGLTFGGVNFVGTEYDGRKYTLSVTTPAYYPVYRGFNGNPTILQAGSNDYNTSHVITATLPAGTTAVGTDLYSLVLGDNYANTVEPVDVTLYSGSTNLGTFTVQTFEKPTLAFAGFICSVPITSLVVVGENDSYANLSSFVFGNSAASAPVNSGPTTTITAKASPADSMGRRLISVTTTNNGKTDEDMLSLTDVTLAGASPAPPPASLSPLPTTPNLLAPGQSQTNVFSFSPSAGTTRAILNVGGTYRDPRNNATDRFSGSLRLSLL